jgi:hypothetical protein
VIVENHLDMSGYDDEDNAMLVFGLIQNGGLWLALHNAGDRVSSAAKHFTDTGATDYARLLLQARALVFPDFLPATMEARRLALDNLNDAQEDELEHLTDQILDLDDPI